MAARSRFSASFERRYNGPLPLVARRVARYGSTATAPLVQARGEGALFSAMARGQIRTVRERRGGDASRPVLAGDLAYYLRYRRAWRRLAAALAAAVAEDEKPRHEEGGASAMMDHPSLDPRPSLIPVLSQ